MARSLIGHLVGAVSGGALYRRASFLLDAAGTKIFPDWFQIAEDPFLQRGFRSAAWDAEGVATRARTWSGRVLCRYVLGSYSARKLGLETTANAGGVHNLRCAATPRRRRAARAHGHRPVGHRTDGAGRQHHHRRLLARRRRLLGRRGEIRHAVDEVTIAGNLRDMFLAIEAVGADVDRRSHVLVGSLLVGG
jgi:PmbA protein